MGLKTDLREDEATINKLAKSAKQPIYTEDGEKAQKQLKGAKYLECSALTQVKNRRRKTTIKISVLQCILSYFFFS